MQPEGRAGSKDGTQGREAAAQRGEAERRAGFREGGPRSEPEASEIPPRWSTLANALTGLRLALAPALVGAILTGAPSIAALVFSVAVATDLADGRVARRRVEASPLGGALDHAVDAVFVTAGTAALASQGVLPMLLPVCIAAAFVQYAVDSRTQAGGLRGSRIGRWNGIAYYVAVGVPVVRDAAALGWPAPPLLGSLGWLLVGTTLVSMATRLRLALRSRRAPGSPGAGTAARSPR